MILNRNKVIQTVLLSRNSDYSDILDLSESPILFSPNNQYIAFDLNDTCFLYDLEVLKLLFKVSVSGINPIEVVDCFDDGDVVVKGSDGDVAVLNKNGEVKFRLKSIAPIQDLYLSHSTKEVVLLTSKGVSKYSWREEQ